MKTDLYTKVVLTVIAISLVTLVFQNFNVVAPAQASNPVIAAPTVTTLPQPANQVIDVNLKYINGIEFGKYNTPSLNVRISDF